MNELTQAMYINLDRQPERDYYVRGMLSGMDTPLDRTVRIAAKDGQLYPDKRSICQGAVQDDFPFFEDVWIDTWMSISRLAGLWSWCVALRSIIEKSQTTLLMVDDYCLRQEWHRFRALVADINEPLKIIQVPACYPHFEQDVESIRTLIPPRYIRHYNLMLNYGFHGMGDGITIYSPDGAKLMLEWIAEDPYENPEKQIYHHSDREIPGCFSVKYPYLWSGTLDQTIFEQAK